MADLFDIVVARKLSDGGGGGGGSSDFSTATVTVVNNLPDDIPVSIYGAFVVNGTLDYWTEFSNGTSQKQVALYLGGVNVFPDEYDNVSVSGNATIDESGIVTITGDCTITIS